MIHLAVAPVALIPASALLILIFYNRFIALSAALHRIQKDIKNVIKDLNADQLTKIEQEEWQKEKDVLKSELSIYHRRSRFMREAIFFCCIGFLFFFISGMFAVLAVYHPQMDNASLCVWLLASVFLLIGLFFGMIELRLSASSSLLETTLLHHL
jgi:hypothetical protein